jgi:hypothetical protein
MGDIPIEDAKSRLLSEAQGYFSGPGFKLASWPTNARQVPESSELQLVLCENERIAKSVCAYIDDTDPSAPTPRRFQNAILAITATPSSFNNALDCAQRLLAAEAIERDHKTGESNKLVRDQMKRIMPELQKKFRIQTCRAFDRIVLAGGSSYPIEEQFQVPDEQVMQRAHGQTCIRKFLETKGLIYQSGDALDVGRFIKDVLPGTTPIPDKPDTNTAKAVHERFLSAPGLRLIPDGGIVRQTILKAVAEGKIVVCLPDGRAYDNQGCVEGQEGKRRRVPGTLTTLSLDDNVLITKARSNFADLWTKENVKEKEVKEGEESYIPRPPKPLDRVTATTWEKVVEYAAERPLLNLSLMATKPSSANLLPTIAQPLGPDSLTLSVMVSGSLKEGGTINFAVNDLKPNHPAKPLNIAQVLFNAIGEGATYEATLRLDFGPAGRMGLEDQLRALLESAPEGVTPQANFGKPIGGER